MTVRAIELDALIRSLEVNRGSPHALFLGAGASLTSGVPSAANCVWRWKRSIFETNNVELKEAVAELSLPSVQNRLDDWLKANQIWPKENEDDYGYFIEQCLPIVDDRRKFFQQLIQAAKPHIGYQLLGLVAEEGIIQSVWTTNFDGLAAKAVASTSRLTPIEVGIESQTRAIRQANRDELLCVSLHGDYRYDKLKNTQIELQSQETTLLAKLTETFRQQSLLISGYSGRDKTIMEALEHAVVNPSAVGKVYWCGYAEAPDQRVAEFLSRAHQAGREAFYVPGVTFDELMVRLCKQCATGERIATVESTIGSTTKTSAPLKASFVLKPKSITALIKSNALELTIPSEAFSLAINSWPESSRWKWMRNRAHERGFSAVPFNGRVLAMATLDQLKTEFTDEIVGSIDRVPITEEDMCIIDGSIQSLVLDSLVHAIARSRSLSTNGRDRLWEQVSFEQVNHERMTYSVHRSALIAIRQIDGRNYLTIDPTFYVPEVDGKVEDAHYKEIVKKKLGYQHNNKYDEDLKYWLAVLKGNVSDRSEVELDYPPDTAAFKFKLSILPLFAQVDEDKGAAVKISPKHQSLVKYSGRIIPEPTLLFATEAGWSPKTDTFPLRGLAKNGPFDELTIRSQPATEVKLSVICPRPESRLLSNFLATYNQKAVVDSNRQGEYLIDYNGFSDIFRCDLIVPRESDANWITISDIGTTDVVAGCREWTRNVCEALTTVASMGSSVVLIASPERWSRYRAGDADGQTFNVHDDVKAFAVRKGIATQFLDQDTLLPYDKSRIWWWLSLAIYTKAMRTPWVLKSIDPNTAFVGLGYSIDHKTNDDKKIILGCSHIYNAQGQGLQFRLRNIQEAKVRRDKNAYLSFNEARQMGETIRQLFWESHFRLPDRVVIHKLFPFTNEEVKGLKAGLDDVRMLELLEINYEPSLRFLKSIYANGEFRIDGYPVRRGTTLKLSKDELLLWVHGATDALKEGRPYFQGKRRIPAPVVIRRYAGTSDVATIVHEVLGLSKMDWNSGDLYSPLPATVKSSKTIARIGQKLSAFGNSSYDYRLFM